MFGQKICLVAFYGRGYIFIRYTNPYPSPSFLTWIIHIYIPIFIHIYMRYTYHPIKRSLAFSTLPGLGGQAAPSWSVTNKVFGQLCRLNTDHDRTVRNYYSNRCEPSRGVPLFHGKYAADGMRKRQTQLNAVFDIWTSLFFIYQDNRWPKKPHSLPSPRSLNHTTSHCYFYC